MVFSSQTSFNEIVHLGLLLFSISLMESRVLRLGWWKRVVVAVGEGHAVTYTVMQDSVRRGQAWIGQDFLNKNSSKHHLVRAYYSVVVPRILWMKKLRHTGCDSVKVT